MHTSGKLIESASLFLGKVMELNGCLKGSGMFVKWLAVMESIHDFFSVNG